MIPLPTIPLSRLLTKSRLSAARQCQRLHDLQYQYGYRPARERDPLRLGTLIHKGLEGIWGRTGTWNYFSTDADPWDLARVRSMLTGYACRYADDVDRYEVLAVEKEFVCPLVNPATGAKSQTWQLAGKLDVIVRDKEDGRVKIVEHKSSSEDISLGSAYWAQLRMDAQVSIYFAGAKSLGYDVAEVIYDVLAKPALKPSKATENKKYTKDGKLYANMRENDETPDEFESRIMADITAKPNDYYQRSVVVRIDGEMDDAMIDVWQSGQSLRESERLGRSPRNPDACRKWNTLCSFFPVCTGAESIDNEMMYSRSDRVHPELSEGITLIPV